MQATPFAVWFIVNMLNAGLVRDPKGVRQLLDVIHAAARWGLDKSRPSMAWNALLAEDRLWPLFKSERDDEIYWEQWNPPHDEYASWGALTDQIISVGAAKSLR